MIHPWIVFHVERPDETQKTEDHKMSFAQKVDARVQWLEQELCDPKKDYPLTTVSVRLPLDVRVKIGLIAEFTSWNLQETLRIMIESAVEDGVRSLSDGGPAFVAALERELARLELDEHQDSAQ